MTRAVYGLGLEFCDDADRLAPLTRARRIKAVDLTASTISVKAQRLRASIEIRYRQTTPRSEAPIDQDALALIDLVQSWRARAAPTGEAARLADLVIERGELFVDLYRRNTAASGT